MRAILAKPISHRTKVDTVYPCRTLRQSRRWAAEQKPTGQPRSLSEGCFFSSLHLIQHELWQVLLMATGSTMSHYCDWAISILIQPASQAGTQAARLPLWEALSWPHAGSALFTVTCLPPLTPPPLCSSPSIRLWMHLSSPLLLKIKSHYCACVGRAECVTLAHSAAG